MNPKTVAELINEASMDAFATSGMKDPDSAKVKEALSQIKYFTELLNFRNGYKRLISPRLNFSEAMQAPDFSILFPKAISNTLERPKEQIMIGQTLLSRTVATPGVRSIEFPTMGAVRAFDLADGQEYPEQQPSFNEQFQEIKTTRSGALINIGEDIIKDSLWDIIGLMVEAVGLALVRHKEEKIFDIATSMGHVVFDNTDNDPKSWTGGRGVDGVTPNFSAGLDDFIDVMGGLINNMYIPTDIVMHPFAWMLFAKDPILRAQFYTQGQIGQTVWKNAPSFDQSPNVPWGIAYQVTPFMPCAQKTLKAVASGGTTLDNSDTLASVLTTDVMVIDRNQGILILQQDPMSMQNWEDYNRECTKIKVRERYGIGAMNQGRAIALMKNVRLEQNFAPVANLGMVTRG